jgi:hypothetical protein
VIKELLADARAIKKKGWTVHILQMPAGADSSQVSPATAETGQPDAADGAEPAGQAESAAADAAETPGRSLLNEIAEELDTQVIPWEDEERRLELAADTAAEGVPAAATASDQQDAQTDQREAPADRQAAATDRPPEASAPEPERRPLWPAVRLPLYILLAALAAAFLVYLFLRLLRSQFFVSKMDKVLQPARTAFSRRPNPLGELIEMRVEGQNTRIGYRNVHRIKRNRSKTVGGGRSHFLIFLVPFPQHAAEISYDGQRFRFSLKKRDVFPQLKGDVENCLDKDIPARSRKGYDLTIRFQRYVSPLEEINRILTLTIQNLFFGS